MEDLQIASLYDYQTDESIFENLESLDVNNSQDKPKTASNSHDKANFRPTEKNSSDLPDKKDISAKFSEDSKSIIDEVEDTAVEKTKLPSSPLNSADRLFSLNTESETSYNSQKSDLILGGNEAPESIVGSSSDLSLSTLLEQNVSYIKSRDISDKTSGDIDVDCSSFNKNEDSYNVHVDQSRNFSKTIDMQSSLDVSSLDSVKLKSEISLKKSQTKINSSPPDLMKNDDTDAELNNKLNNKENKKTIGVSLSFSDRNEDILEEFNNSFVNKAKIHNMMKENINIKSLNAIQCSKPDVYNTEFMKNNEFIGMEITTNSGSKQCGGHQRESIPSEGKSAEGDDDETDDDYFNPLLLCPEVSMDVDESPVLTAETNMTETKSSPLPFEESSVTYVDEMTGAEISFNLTREEQELRTKMYGPNNPIEYTKIHCTACNVHLGSALEGQKNRFVHPLLKVIICKNCYHFYTSGEFEKDEDGSELYCRWCGQGGQVICCSKCEYVFCKKCIRNNFGRKKVNEVRDSDEWLCFRCEPSQMMVLRATCYEFFNFIRRELLRASSSSDTSFMSVDHTRCCTVVSNSYGKKKNIAENELETEKKRRRKNSSVDPDYNPLADKIDDLPIINSSVSSISEDFTNKVTPVLKGAIHKVDTSTSLLATTAENSLMQNNSIAKASVSIKTTVINTNVVSPSEISKPQFRPIAPVVKQIASQFPSGIKVAVARPQQQQKSPIQPIPARARSSSIKPVASGTKHEWFEKTVRSAARVNSNLSYTLTQLNKAQASADSIEALAVVHNKLQEILSNSINSLIQIRKNLRTEFIAGIKSIKFPPKPSNPIVDSNDDDVILVTPGPNTTTLTPLLVPPQVPSLVPLSSDNIASNTTSVNILSNHTLSQHKEIKSCDMVIPEDKPKMYLKVRSFSQLQTVPAEYITIPDDPLSPDVKGDDNKDEDEKEAHEHQDENVVEESIAVKEDNTVSYNLNDPSEEVHKMSSVKVNIVRSEDVDILAKQYVVINSEND